MDEKKYKAPNGQVYTQTELQDRYGDRFESLVSEGQFEETEADATTIAETEKINEGTSTTEGL